MADPDSVPFTETDPQDLAEVFDETHLDEEGDDFALPEEMTDVYDATRAHERDHDRDLPTRLSPHDRADDARRRELLAQADSLLGEKSDAQDDDETIPVSEQEIELVSTGLMRNQRGAQGSASHWEARSLSDEDIRDLGYAPDPVAPATEQQEERP